MTWFRRIIKSVVAGLSSAGAPEIINAVTDSSIVWGWQYALASFFGVGFAVWIVPNKHPEMESLVKETK